MAKKTYTGNFSIQLEISDNLSSGHIEFDENGYLFTRTAIGLLFLEYLKETIFQLNLIQGNDIDQYYLSDLNTCLAVTKKLTNDLIDEIDDLSDHSDN